MTTVLLASDADWLIEEVRAALSDPGTTVNVVRAGADVRALVSSQIPDLVILDLQIGNMGGMATCMDLRLEIDAERLSPVPILMLLDREADVYLAQQAGAQGWLVKPLDSFRLKMAAVALLAGEDMREGTTPETERLSEGISPEESEFGSDEDKSTDTEEVPQVT
ncbi:MAG: response regulator transcription factor [Acidimicrobiales bacterium]